MKSVAAVTGVRADSKRIENKNFRPFAGSNLFEIKIQQLLELKGIDRVYVSTNDQQALAVAESLGAVPLPRPDELCSDTANISQFAPHFAEQIEEEVLLYTLVTCPLVENQTYERALAEFLVMDTDQYDSLSSFAELKAFLWKEGVPFNYDPANQPRSQDLPSMHRFHPAITILDREKVFEVKNVVGPHPKPFTLKPHEEVDVDWMLEFFIAEKLYEEIVLKGNTDICHEL